MREGGRERERQTERRERREAHLGGPPISATLSGLTRSSWPGRRRTGRVQPLPPPDPRDPLSALDVDDAGCPREGLTALGRARRARQAERVRVVRGAAEEARDRRWQTSTSSSTSSSSRRLHQQKQQEKDKPGPVESTPLLASEEEEGRGGGRMEGVQLPPSPVGPHAEDGAGIPSPFSSSSSSFSSLPLRALELALRVPTAADAVSDSVHPLCLPGGIVLSHGRLTLLILPAAWIILTVLWLPLSLLSLLITEAGIYVLVLLVLTKAGRSVLRLIAFPGSSHRVLGEVEAEFARYSVRMLGAALDVVLVAASAVLEAGGGMPPPVRRDPPEGGGGDGGGGEKEEGGGEGKGEGHQLYDDDGTSPDVRAAEVERHLVPIPGGAGGCGPADAAAYWARARSYRGRVLAVYSDVLVRVLAGGEGGPTEPAEPAPGGIGAGDSDGGRNLALTRSGNNPLRGDVGDLAGVTSRAAEAGRHCSGVLLRVLADMAAVEVEAGPAFSGRGRGGGAGTGTADFSPRPPSVAARRAAASLLRSATELRDLLPSLRPMADPDPDGGGGGAGVDDPSLPGGAFGGADGNADGDALRRRLRQQRGQQVGPSGSTAVDAARAGLDAVLPMLDPPGHGSVFGLDVLRGCVLSRYLGARQLWVARPGGSGRIDVLHFPSPAQLGNGGGGDGGGPGQRRAVLYCNPNAGLMEIAAGMSLIGGNACPSEGAGSEQEGCWVDFYTERGYDVYVFNYAGFGRSTGARGGRPPAFSRSSGLLGRLLRILRGSLWDFLPSPKSLKADGLAVARYLVDQAGVNHLVIHGESIGGMAAASAARGLSNDAGVCVGSRGENSDVACAKQPALLLCDRSFCNLEAVAERLVGGWSGRAIRILTPFWNTDVAGDFMAARCPKIVANDAADAIIADPSALKSGLAISRELQKGVTWGVSRMSTAPFRYRMADWENVGVVESKYARGFHLQPPEWPADKHIAAREAYHFAACVRRIGKVATVVRKAFAAETRRTRSASDSEDEDGIEITAIHRENGTDPRLLPSPTSSSKPSDEDRVLEVWKALACCDGMCGAPLGTAVKDGYDSTVSWLCSTVTYGAQVVADAAQRRTVESGQNASDLAVESADFDFRPDRYAQDESGPEMHPLPMTTVISTLKQLSEDGGSLMGIETEVKYCMDVLEYIVARLTAKNMVSDSIKVRQLSFDSEALLRTGCFLNLTCGHNNQYSASERGRLFELMERAAA